MNSLYNLSTDYQELFALICQGHIVAGFVDYVRGGTTPVMRDICQIARHHPWDIFIGVRGTSYGYVYSYMVKHFPDEEAAFVRTCENVNLAWIVPEKAKAQQ